MTLLAQAISTALLDLVWQGALIGAATWLVLAALRHQAARVRYVVSCVALLLLAALPLLTVATVWSIAAGTHAASATEATLATPTAIATSAPVPQTLLQIWMVPDAPRVVWLDLVHPWILPIWAVGVFVLSIRLTAAWWHATTLARSAIAPDPSIVPIVGDLARRIGVSRHIQVRATPATATPSVVGWLRPVLLVPPAAAMGLTVTQLEAVLAHELAHIKRHDYLVNMMQIVVETLFFYHPVIWWTSRQIRLEREVCCDDVAVEACGNAADYARGLTALARRQLTPLAQAATGGPLVYRVRRLLGLAPREFAAGDLAGIVAMAVAIAGIVLHMDRLQAQEAADARPRFDAASVKVNDSGDRIVMTRSLKGRVAIRGLSVAELIRQAYRVQEFQIVGGPDWINSARFDIQAVYPPEIAERRERGREDLMLRALLEERFKLAVHKETQQRPVFALVFARSDRSLGSQLTRSTADCAAARAGDDCNGWVGPGYIRSRGRTMAQIATAFSALTNTGSSLNRLVVDRTGLDGVFNMELRFTPEVLPPMSPNQPEWLPEIDPNGPSIFSAVQEQLGLKLDPQQGPVEVLVIDRVERPTPD